MSNSTEKTASDGPKKLVVCIKTFGCQMNMYDTEVAEGLLEKAGFQILKEESLPIERSHGHFTPTADIVLMNTCSVREHAEERVFGRLGMLGKAKKENPNLVVGLMGCMVEEHRQKLFKRFPQLDLMVGTRNIKELPDLVNDVLKNRKQVAQIKQDGISIEYTDMIKRKGEHHAWLPIMTGCNKVCTFCIVPITRGREVSMPAREVYRETSRLVDEGVKWITLLGQNVNSYDSEGITQFPRVTLDASAASVMESQIASVVAPPRNDNSSVFAKQSRISFPELLEQLCEISGLERISFTTSHPHDATEELFQVIARNPKISRRFHLPLQSGSDRILKRMKRLHTYEEYKGKIDRMREIILDISVTTDIIAGFSGETDEDHEQTKQALREINYDGAYIYKYSIRPATPAAKLPDDVPLEIKEKRNQELLALQRTIMDKNNQDWLGKTVQVFAESVNLRNSSELAGRSDQERKIVFAGDSSLIGSFRKVVIKALHRDTFLADLVAQ